MSFLPGGKFQARGLLLASRVCICCRELRRLAGAYLKAVTAPHPPLIKNRITKATTNHRSDFPCGSRARAWVENAVMLWPFAEGVDSRTLRCSYEDRLSMSYFLSVGGEEK